MNKDFLHLVEVGKMTWQELQDMLIKFNTAMAECQGEINIVKENSEAGGNFKWKFADWSSIREATRPILKKHGLSAKIYHVKKDEELFLVAEIKHSSGYIEITESPIICDTGGTKNKVEYGICGAITYYKRYVYNGIFGIATEEPDSELEPIEESIKPLCPKCNATMRLINGETGYFWGCPKFKSTGCNGTRAFNELT